MKKIKKASGISKGNIENLKPWKPGESGNISGRPKTPEEIKKLRKLSAKEFIDIADMVVRGSWSELEKIAKDKSETVLRVKLAKGILDESYKTFDEILNRLIGKVKDELDLNLPKPTIISFGPNRIELGSKLDNEGEE